MKIPLLWLKDYVNTNKTPREIAEAFTALGLMLDKPMENGVLDLEHRMDRSDWLSLLGCTRDFAAFTDTRLQLPATNTKKARKPTKEQLVKIKVNCPQFVNRFNTRVFRNIKVTASPEWLKTRLELYGIPSINNIVDITNFVMVEYGQPMHAQDLAKFRKQEIVIREAQDGESITTLDGTKIALKPEMFVLTQDNYPTVIGGVVGGKETAVDETTTNIILDAGNYKQASIRKISRDLKIQNETVLRYDKFLHPHLTQIALERATQLILDLAGGDYYENEDYYPNPSKPKRLALTAKRLLDIGGITPEKNHIRNILTKLDYKIIRERNNTWELEIPYFRTDIEVEDDIAADILRISDYKNITGKLLEMTPPKEITPKIYVFEEMLRDILVQLGCHEHITDPITSRNGNPHQVLLENSVNVEKDALRTTLKETLYPVTGVYEKHKIDNIPLFEIGLAYKKEDEAYKETRLLEIVHGGMGTPKERNERLKRIVAGLLENLGITEVDYEPGINCAEIYQKELKLGELYVDTATFYTENLLKTEKNHPRVKSELANNINEDISMILEITAAAGPILTAIKKLDNHILDIRTVGEYLLEKAQKSVTIRITFDTTNNEEVAKIKAQIIKLLEDNYQITIRRK